MSSPTLKMLLLGEDRSASKALKGVANEAENTGRHLSGFGKIAKGVFAGMIVRDAVNGTVDFLKESAKAAIEDQESTDRLAKAMHNNAGATKAQDAAVEGWISKMEIAKGVADDDLRGGLQRLVQSTHSVSESQKLMGVAMDAAAGTGKSVTAVAAAMAKAHDGNVGALGRLGIATKDAKGKTMSFNDVLKNMATTFKGQSTKAADSMQGRMNRLKITWAEMQESLGYKLLPILEKVGEWFLTKGVPVIQKTATIIGHALTPVVDKVRAAFQRMQPILQKVGTFLSKNPQTVKTFVTVLVALGGAVLVVTAAMAAWTAIMDANPIGLIVLALAGLAAGLQYAWTHSQTFRTVVTAAFDGVKKAVSTAWDVIKGVFHLWVNVWFSVIGAMVNGAAKAFGWIPGIGDKLKKAADTFNGFRDKVNNALNGIHKSVHVSVTASLDATLRGGGKKAASKSSVGSDPLMTGIAQNSPRMRVDPNAAGRQMVADFRAGAHKQAHAVNLSKEGADLVSTFISGTKSQKTKLHDALKSIHDQVKQSRDQFKSDMASFADSFTSFSSSVFGADYGTDESGNALPVTVNAILAKAQQQKDQADALHANIAKLIGEGANADVLQQIQSAGQSGIAQINALASGASIADIQRLNSLTSGTLASDRAAGHAAAGVLAKTPGNQLFDDATQQSLAEKIAREIGKLDLGGHTVLQLDGKTIEASVAKTHRKQGKKK